MKRNKKVSNSNASFITNHQLIEWVKNKSSRNIDNLSTVNDGNDNELSVGSTLHLKKNRGIAMIPKKSYNLNQNVSMISNFEISRLKQNKNNPLQQIAIALREISQQLTNSKKYNHIPAKIDSIIESLKDIKGRSQGTYKQQHSRSVIKLNTQKDEQYLEKIKHQKIQIRELKKTIEQLRENNGSLSDKLAKWKNSEERTKRADTVKSIQKQDQSASKQQKLHKIILKQSELIERQVEQKSSEKENLLMMIQNQAKSIEQMLTRKNGFIQNSNINASLKLSIDLESYLLSSVNYTDTNRMM